MAVTDIESRAWIRRYHPSGASTARLICFPHAGGSASYFHPVSERFSPATDVIALQYPGRQDRRHELCIRDIDVLADRITEQLLCLSHKPSVFFGHSMGATLAFEVAWRLERKGFNAPLHLTASGRRAQISGAACAWELNPDRHPGAPPDGPGDLCLPRLRARSGCRIA